MRVCSTGTIVVAVLMLFAVPPQAFAQPKVATIYHQQQLPAAGGQLETFKVTCPPGYQAVSGAPTNLPPGVKLLKSASVGRAQVFLFSPSTLATTVGVVVTCIRKTAIKIVAGTQVALPVGLKLKGKSLKLLKKQSAAVNVQCPSDSAPAGPQVAVNAPATAKAFRLFRRSAYPALGDLTLVESMPVRGGWPFMLRNDGDSDATGKVGVACLKRKLTRKFGGRRLVERLKIVRTTSQESFGAGGDVAGVDCPRASVPLAAGFDFQAHLRLTMLEAHPVTDRPAIKVVTINDSPTPLPGTVAALCIVGHRVVF